MRSADAREQAGDRAAGRGSRAGFRPLPGHRFSLARLPVKGGEREEEGIQRWGAAIGGLGGEGWLSRRAGARGAANFPGEGALSAPELTRKLPPPSALTPGSGRLRSQRSESNVIYLFACVQPLGLDPTDTPWTWGACVRSLQPPPSRCGRLPGIRARAPPANPPRAPTRVGVGLHPGSKSPPRREQGKAEGRGRLLPSPLSFQNALSLPGWVGPEPLKAEPPPALAPAALPELSRRRRWRQTDRGVSSLTGWS